MITVYFRRVRFVISFLCAQTLYFYTLEAFKRNNSESNDIEFGAVVTNYAEIPNQSNKWN